MIHCPKCGFEQPKDEYCAKCGIRVDIYNASGVGLVKRLGSSLIFYGLIVGGVLGGIFYFIYSQSQKPLETAAQLQRQYEETMNILDQEARPKSTPLPLRETGTFAETKSLATNETQTPAATPIPTATPIAKQDNTVEIEFSLVDIEGLRKLGQDAQGTLSVGRYALSSISNFKTRKASLSANIKPLASESRPLTLNQAAVVFRGGKDSKTNETIGFFVELTPYRIHENGADYKLQIKRNLPEATSSGEWKVQSQTFDETVSIAKGATVGISGLLPRKPIVDEEVEMYKSIVVLNPLLEEDFVKGNQEFVVFVTPE